MTDKFKNFKTKKISELLLMVNPSKSSIHTIGGRLKLIKQKTTKQGKPMIYFVVSDYRDGAEINCVYFGKDANIVSGSLKAGALIICTGRADASYGTISLVVDTIKTI